MNFEKHLFVGWSFTSIILLFLFILGYNVLEARIVPYLIIGISVFSVLPDIDHAKSKPSRFLSICLLILAFYSIINYYTANSQAELLKTCFWALLFVIHRNYAISSKRHRRFPHTFTFGILSSAALLFLSNSGIVGLACFISFLSHLVIDKHVLRALGNDKRLFKKIFH